MRTSLVAAMSVGAFLVLAGNANAHTKKRSYGHPVRHSASSELEDRKARNEWAYNHGGYWEHDSNALRVGSRAWFEQKERERGDRR